MKMKYYAIFMLILSMAELINTQQEYFIKECSEKLRPYSIYSNHLCQTTVQSSKAIEILPFMICLEQNPTNSVIYNQFDKEITSQQLSQLQEVYSQEIIIDDHYKYLRIQIQIQVLENQIILMDEVFFEIISDFNVSLIFSKLNDFTIIKSNKIGWICFQFDGIVQINYKFIQLKILSKVLKLNQQPFFLEINNFDVWGINIKNPFKCMELDEQQEIINCGFQGFIYNYNIKQCVFEKDTCAELNQFENLQQKQCTNTCDTPEYQYQSQTDGRQYCIQGYNTCNSPTMNGCSVCDINTLLCFSCKDGFQLLSNACWLTSQDVHSISQDLQTKGLEKQRILQFTIMCPIRCSSCFNQNLFCSACVSPFILFQGYCVLCPRGTYPDPSGCIQITQVGCAQLDSSLTNCIACFYGFTINITLGTCTKTIFCTINQFASPLGCTACISPCSQCYSSTICFLCISGYNLIAFGWRLADPSIQCGIINPGSGFYALNNFYIPCTPFCSTCTSAYPNPPSCTLCETGFLLVSGVCQNQSTCPTANCSLCSALNQCQICNSGYYLETTTFTCIPCLNMCSTCSNTNSCLTCKNASLTPPACTISCPNMFQNTVTGRCSVCGTLCQSCTNGDLCTICIPNYALISGKCYPCQSNCSVCSDENRCVTCKQNFNLIANVCSVCASSPCQPCLSGFYFDNTSQSCLACSPFCSTCNNSVTCQVCMNTYFLNNNTQNCSLCNSISCTTICGDGIRNDPMMIGGIAILKQCDDRNTQNNDGCSSTCQIELGYTCLDNPVTLASICQQIHQNTFTISSSYNTVNGNPIIKIKFTFAIVQDPLQAQTGTPMLSLLQALQKDMFTDILTVPTSTYTLIMTLNPTSDEITLEFTPTQMIKNKVLHIEFKNINFLQANNITPAMKDYPFPDFVIISPSQKEQAKQIALVGTVASQSILLVVIPTILFANIQILFNALDLFQMIFYLQYVDARLPFNVKEFIKTVQGVRIPSLINIFQYLIDIQPVNPPPVPSPFLNGGLSTIFILDIGDSISQLLILGIVHLGLKGIIKITQNMKAQVIQNCNTYLSTKLVQSWQWAWYLDMFWEMYLSIVVGSILQFYGGEIQNFASFLNFSLSILFFILVLYTPFFFWNIINKQSYKLNYEDIRYKWGMIYEGLNIHNQIQIAPSDLDYSPDIFTKNQKQFDFGFQQVNNLTEKKKQETSITKQNAIFSNRKAIEDNNNINKTEIGVPDIQCESRLKVNYFDIKQRTTLQRLAKYFYIALYLRKLLFGIMISTLTISPYLQVILIGLLNAVLIAFIYRTKPYQHSFENFKSIICEIFMIIAQFAIILLISDNDSQSESDRMSLGWIFVMGCSGIMIIQIIYILMQVLPKIKQAIVDFTQLCKPKKKLSPDEIEKQKSVKEESENSKSVLSYQNYNIYHHHNNSASIVLNLGANYIDLQQKSIAQRDDKEISSKIIESYQQYNPTISNSLIQSAKSLQGIELSTKEISPSDQIQHLV